MKTDLSVAQLDRVVKFTHDLNALATKHGVGFYGTTDGDVRLVMDSKPLPFVLAGADEDDDLFLVVSL